MPPLPVVLFLDRGRLSLTVEAQLWTSSWYRSLSSCGNAGAELALQGASGPPDPGPVPGAQRPLEPPGGEWPPLQPSAESTPGTLWELHSLGSSRGGGQI